MSLPELLNAMEDGMFAANLGYLPCHEKLYIRDQLLGAAYEYGKLLANAQQAESCGLPFSFVMKMHDHADVALEELKLAAIAHFNQQYDGETE